MPELTKSQKVIFAILAVVVLYAVYDLLLFPSKPKNVKTAVEAENQPELKDLLTATVAKMSQTMLPAKYEHLIARAEAGWPRNPFIERSKYRELILKRSAEGIAAEETQPKKVPFVYSGYIVSGTQVMAIINNVEYNIDEHLETEGYILRKVLPDKVVIEDKAKRQRFEVPLQE